MSSAIIGIDWGSTNRRAFLIEGVTAGKTLCDDRGALGMSPGDYANEIAALRACWGNVPVLLAGMAGSNRGWAEASYVECPARLEAIAREILWIKPGSIGIVPGVCLRIGGPDVMRGEEIQFFGAMASGGIPDGALLCQPGTHCKWARMSGGAITAFTTAMTGELFALLRGHSLLAPQLQSAAAPGAAFAEGVADAGRLSLAAALFRVRSASLLGMRDDRDGAAYASGVLIGADVAAQLGAAGGPVYVIADGVLGELYAQAIVQLGGIAHNSESGDAFVAGIAALTEHIR
jgi:2-dehydro-3-deoxygalactonokinase